MHRIFSHASTIEELPIQLSDPANLTPEVEETALTSIGSSHEAVIESIEQQVANNKLVTEMMQLVGVWEGRYIEMIRIREHEMEFFKDPPFVAQVSDGTDPPRRDLRKNANGKTYSQVRTHVVDLYSKRDMLQKICSDPPKRDNFFVRVQDPSADPSGYFYTVDALLDADSYLYSSTNKNEDIYKHAKQKNELVLEEGIKIYCEEVQK
jgi:hypothetical protein